ncbi:uncharacterized protein FSUBG_2021 [Fusarium subglutinans]|uniref:Uncharacterized protein n=1 Tax=Gibberella subglutinans TaxID=42677 RepID=A0A8H5V7Y9_GIBSU|nr:uncharacterized protein FSUBG_2021 [Fusarium subglutinans]KAF5611584.1 hypothetical protein FSUBG_2021 [Fusarium subglutinans]
MCFFKSEEQHLRGQNAWKYRHTNFVFNNAGGQYIERKGADALRAGIPGRGPLYEHGPMRSHAITHRNRPRDDHTASPTFEKVNWSGDGNGADQLRRVSPLGSVRSECHSPEPVFKKVDWNAKGNPVRSASPLGTTSRLSAGPRDAPMIDTHKLDNIKEEGQGRAPSGSQKTQDLERGC